MANQKLNVFIVDDNKLMDISLKQFLENRFREKIHISLCNDEKSCLERVDQNTHIVILDHCLTGENINAKKGLEIIKSIKKINPQTEVIMSTCNEDAAVAIQSISEQATTHVLKSEKDWEKLIVLIKKNITDPVRLMVKEFGILKFLILFLITFIGMATIVYWALMLLP